MGIFYNMFIFYGFIIKGDYKTILNTISLLEDELCCVRNAKGLIIYAKSSYYKLYDKFFEDYKQKNITLDEIIKNDYESDIDLTWYTPSKEDNIKLKKIMNKCFIPDNKLRKYLYVHSGWTGSNKVSQGTMIKIV